MATKIMRLINTNYDSICLVKDDNATSFLCWMDEIDVINMLASTGMVAKTASVDRDSLNVNQKKYFDILWADEGETIDLEAAFDKLFKDYEGSL